MLNLSKVSGESGCSLPFAWELIPLEGKERVLIYDLRSFYFNDCERIELPETLEVFLQVYFQYFLFLCPRIE